VTVADDRKGGLRSAVDPTGAVADVPAGRWSESAEGCQQMSRQSEWIASPNRGAALRNSANGKAHGPVVPRRAALGTCAAADDRRSDACRAKLGLAVNKPHSHPASCRQWAES
jgi:hypothetical protein